MQKTVQEIAKLIKGEVAGDASVVIKGVSGIKEARHGEIRLTPFRMGARRPD